MNALRDIVRRAYEPLVTGANVLQSPLLLALRVYFFWQLFLTGKGKLSNIGDLLHLVVIGADALGDSNMPSGLYSENGWNLMFQKKNGLIVMWASQAPMDDLKQLLVET